MNKAILKLFLRQLFNEKTTLIISTLTYYFLLAIIPTFLLLNLLLKSIHFSSLNLPFINAFSYDFSFSFIISLLLITLCLLSRVFFTFLQTKRSIKYSFLYSLLLSFAFFVLLTLFLCTFLLENSFIKHVFLFILLTITLIIISVVINVKVLKYSLIFSSPFSIIICCFLYLFEAFSTQFLQYENYYGLLAPLFIFILEINLVIYLIYSYYLLSETYTKISNIKIIKM